MIDKDYFLTIDDWKKFRLFLHKWDDRLDYSKTDDEMESKLQEIIETCESDMPRLDSITKGAPEDYMKLKKIEYISNKEEFELNIIFESDLKTSAELSYTFDKEVK